MTWYFATACILAAWCFSASVIRYAEGYLSRAIFMLLFSLAFVGVALKWSVF